MNIEYKPLSERTPDEQYANSLRFIQKRGIMKKKTAQGIGALTCFGTLPPMVFDLSNGIPCITERKIGYKMSIAEKAAFLNGARTIDEIGSFGCKLWDDYRGKGTELGLEPNDMGPGSYGAAFHDFEIPGGGTLNQFAQVIEQIRNYPDMRTHLVTPWKPYYTARGPNRKVIVAPCHGWLHFEVLEGRLHMRMDQRSADMPIGVPSNMVQYAALLLMMCQVTGYPPGNYVHSFADAHIYENQFEAVEEMLSRSPRVFPILKLDPSVTDLFAFRAEHFTREEYDPHPAIDVPYSP
ncbi:MAG: Thymidylate synthase [Parcubacteria group bacterium]|nr:Thymidylate synthase [Parcubacteria group bacterium]